MKIYLYLSNFPPHADNFVEGLTKAVHGLACGLVKSGAEVVVLCEVSPNGDSIYKTPFGYEIKCFANLIQDRPSFKISPNLKKFIRESVDRNSLVILNGIFHLNVYSMSRILKKCNIPYIIAPHDPYNPEIFHKNSHLKWLYWHLLERRMLCQAKAIQVLDYRHGEFINQLGVNTPIIAIHNGFYPTDVYPETSLKWRYTGDSKLFFLGRIDSYNKGLDLLLDAFSKIIQNENANLTIQGPDWGDKQKLIEKVAQLSLGEKVSFPIPDYNKSPSLLIQNYDIFCIPSRFEGFSLAALEAMLAGRVLLVSEIAGIAPHVKASGCGVVVKPEVLAIKSGLVELLKRRSEWQEMGLRGRYYALKHLNWEKIASDALNSYKALVFNNSN